MKPTLAHGLVLASGLALASGAVGQTYSIQELPPLPGQTRSFGFGINNAGVVVGQSGPTAGMFNAARWVNGVPESLGVLAPYPFALALDINAGDQVVGQCSNANETIPFIWENGVMAALPTPPGYNRGVAQRINDSGVAVGYVYLLPAPPPPGDASQPCLWQFVGGQWTARILPTPDSAGGVAEDINNAGIVVGRTWADNAACKWDSTIVPTVMSMVAVGPPSAIAAGVFGINDMGRMAAGYITADVLGRSELLNSGPTQPIGTLPGFAHLFISRISNSNIILGHGYNGDAFDPFGTFIDCRAIVWRDGTLSTFNDVITNGAGWDVRQTWDINASGQVAGLGTLHGAPNHRALLLTPCYANCDGSLESPLLTANDFQCFLNRFASGTAYANCDGSTGTPSLTGNDFQCFLNKFATGCS